MAKRLSHSWQLVLAFFLGGAVSSLAQDPSDYFFFKSSAQGALNVQQQTLLWYWVPFTLYGAFFLLGYFMSKIGVASPSFLLYFFGAIVVFSFLAQLQLPQASSSLFLGSAFLGTVISLGILAGLRRHV